MNRIYASIGSNIQKERNIVSCVQALRKKFSSVELSYVYESTAVGFEGDNFYNMVAGFYSDLSPYQVRAILREIEIQHHRVRGREKFVSRTLDLDQLTHGDHVFNSGGLELPAPEIAQDAYVLYPFADLAGGLIHTPSGKTYARLRDEFDGDGLLLSKRHFTELEQRLTQILDQACVS